MIIILVSHERESRLFTVPVQGIGIQATVSQPLVPSVLGEQTHVSPRGSHLLVVLVKATKHSSQPVAAKSGIQLKEIQFP